MTQEEKDLIYKDLCGRLSSGVIVQQSAKYPKGHSMHNVADKWDTEPHNFKIIGVEGTNTLITDKRKEERTYAKGIVSSPITISIHNGFTGQVVKPYLRSILSTTEEEQYQLGRLLGATSYNLLGGEYSSLKDLLEYVYKNHIDLFGLIPMGLALEAPEGMYNI